MTVKIVKSIVLGSVVVAGFAGYIGWAGQAQPGISAEMHTEEKDHGDHGDEPEGVKIQEAQIIAAGIKTAQIGPGNLLREVAVPGKIIAAADRMAQIVPKVGGIVAEARKNLGDHVEKSEILAVIESREMAEAVAEHQAAKRAEELSRITYKREKTLWDKKITAEQDYLNAKNVYQEAQIRLDLARQKLRALGYDIGGDADKNSRFHEMKSPFAGRVIARELTLGEYVDATHSAYTVADLGIVWVETAIAPADLSFVKEGQIATIKGGKLSVAGKLIFVSPVIDPATRTAKAIIQLDNAEGVWRPGEFVNVAIATSDQEIALLLPKEAMQNIESSNVVFVKSGDGFEKRAVITGREDSRNVEILSGVKAGEEIAVTNTFTLKADLGKAEAEHEH